MVYASRDPVRVCIVGLGWTGSNHFAGYSAIPEKARVVAAVVRSEQGQAKAQQLGIPKTYPDWRAALEDQEIDAIDFCTPGFLHADQSIAALEAGKHVFCEAPACQSGPDCRRIRWALINHPEQIAVTGHVARSWPTFRHAKRLVDEGTVGQVFYVSSSYAHKPDPDEYPSAKTWARNILSHARMGVGYHSLDLVRWYAGDVFEVTGDQTDKCGIAVLHFKNGALGKVFSSGAVVRPYILSLSVYGTEGTIVCWWEENELRGYLHRSANWEPTELERTPMHGRGSPEWTYEMTNFVDAIRGTDKPRCPMGEGVAMIETGLAIQQALDTGVRVRVVRP
ncbi:MAG TPA: Gfo/Idh/MocA family oxidoreductase [Chloroflexota bacterium]|jgi:myo-inositol 2-dehydrogenase/D-chiro-inositol 1-dehydrogenase|nr:Gfo/Idh/MocA family oxidoreductase [Chloroflexota bacterium]